MGYWGWRPLVFGLFISIWVVGCNIVTDNASPSAAPTAYPDVTLTVGRLPSAPVSAAPTRGAPPPASTPTEYVVQPGDTLEQIAAQFDVSLEALQSANPEASTLTPGQTLLIPPLPPLLVQPPTCYQIRPNSLLCLGRVDNPLDFPVESAGVEVRLLQADGSPYLTERSTVDQASIPSGGFAPYRATFAADAGSFASADARLFNALRGDGDRFVTLLTEDINGELIDGHTIVRATIFNPGPRDAELMRVFATLLDDLGRVIGYRVMSFDAGTILDAGAQYPLSIDVTPQVTTVTPNYALYVEARAVEE